MPNVRVTIDGKELSVPANSTILEAARMAGIDIPTLCDHPAVEPIGACRICLVEVEKQRTLQPACTFPVFEGMVVQTHSEKAVGARKFVLQLLFSERNHFCMFCQMSGSCELQKLAYRYELDHWIFERPMPKYPVDASRVYFVMDHNRCILCRRCIRVCDELVGNGTLGLKNRGAETIIIADLDVPFGESSCVSCGTCLQVCPTGALMDRASAYMGATEEIQRVKSRCMACPVGCGVEWIVRENRLIRVEGDWDAQPNKGLLCEIGRFKPLHEKRTRVRKPLVRENGEWVSVEMESALATVAERLKEAQGNVATIVSGFVTLEEAQRLTDLPGAKYLLGPAPAQASSATLADLDLADLYLVINTDLTKDYQVAGFAIKRSVRHRGARLLLVSDGEDGLAEWALRQVASNEVDALVEIAEKAEMPVIIAGPQGIAQAVEVAKRLPNAKLLSLVPGGNTRGLYEAGIKETFAGQAAAVYYVVAGELANVPEAFLEQLTQAGTVIVSSCYREPWDGVAQVILPMPTTFEKNGTTVNVDGQAEKVVAGVQTRVPSVQQVVDSLLS